MEDIPINTEIGHRKRQNVLLSKKRPAQSDERVKTITNPAVRVGLFEIP